MRLILQIGTAKPSVSPFKYSSQHRLNTAGNTICIQQRPTKTRRRCCGWACLHSPDLFYEVHHHKLTQWRLPEVIRHLLPRGSAFQHPAHWLCGCGGIKWWLKSFTKSCKYLNCTLYILIFGLFTVVKFTLRKPKNAVWYPITEKYPISQRIRHICRDSEL